MAQKVTQNYTACATTAAELQNQAAAYCTSVYLIVIHTARHAYGYKCFGPKDTAYSLTGNMLVYCLSPLLTCKLEQS